MKLGKMRDAKTYLSRGLKIQPKDANLLYSMGILEGNLENFEGAEQYLDKALIIRRSPDIIYALALTKMKLKDNSSAAKLFEEYKDFNRSNPDILYKLGLLFIELKDYDKARKAFQDTLTLSPENERAREYLRSLDKSR
jgi:tetratricopeptide (TPR) repeat protein